MIKAVALLVTLALTGVLILQWRDWPRPLSPVAPRAAAQGATALAQEPAAGLPTAPAPPEGKETYAGVAERPLFRPQRKPEPPPSTEPTPSSSTQADGTLDGLDLTAVLISPAVTAAWIKDPSVPALKRLGLGDEQAGWSVKAILADRLVFERQGQTHELLLLDLAAAKAAPPVASPPPRPVPSARPGSPPARPASPGRPNPGVVRPPGMPRSDPQRTQLPRPPGAPGPPGATPRVAPPSSTLPQPRPNVPRPPPLPPR